MIAILAQLVEQLIRNEQVVGSNPMDGSIFLQNRPPQHYEEKRAPKATCFIFLFYALAVPIRICLRLTAHATQPARII